MVVYIKARRRSSKQFSHHHLQTHRETASHTINMAMANYNTVKAAVCSLLLACSLIAIAPYVKAEISCPLITIQLTPCIPYGVLGGEVPEACCQGVKDSQALVKTTEDLREKCQCVKDGAAGIPGLNYTRVNELPAKCGTKELYVVSPNTDCSKLVLKN
ncbi:Non-specific lipid-transfer protein Cor a 8.0101 [Linum grandiflorum]